MSVFEVGSNDVVAPRTRKISTNRRPDKDIFQIPMPTHPPTRPAQCTCYDTVRGFLFARLTWKQRVRTYN